VRSGFRKGAPTVVSYFAAIWNVRNEMAAATSVVLRERVHALHPNWVTPIQKPGLMVKCSGAPQLKHPKFPNRDNNAVVLGTLFRRGDVVPIGSAHDTDVVTSDEEERLLRTNARSAIVDYWGSYVLISRNPSTGGVSVLRSPMGMLPCFHATVNGVSTFFSSAEDFANLNMARLPFNWEQISAQAALGDYLTRETALRPITSLECGECMELDAERTARHIYWSACEVARQEPIESFNTAVAQIREATQLSVNAWSNGHQLVLQTLSGGLDSSIVLSCLARTPNRPRVVSVNYYTRHEHGDERLYARAMARLAESELIEKERNATLDLSILARIARTARPIVAISTCDTHPATSELGRERNATAIFNGELGDNIFGAIAGPEPVTEYAWRRGIRPRLFGVAKDCAKLIGNSTVRTLCTGIRDGLVRAQPSIWSAFEHTQRISPYDHLNGSLISADALNEYRRNIDRFIHPWLKDVQGVPPGKIPTVYGILTTTSVACQNPFSAPNDPVTISPLISQPLAEVALRIASYTAMQGGLDRAVARTAFRQQLPEDVYRRTGGGTIAFWIQDVAKHNRAFLKDLLLDGMLVKQRILDRGKLEKLLSAEPANSAVPLAHIFPQLFIEAWLQRWSHATPRLVA